MEISLILTILCLVAAGGFVLYGGNIVYRQAKLMDRIIEDALELSVRTFEVTNQLVECHEAWTQARELSQCPACRTKAMLKGATWHG